MQHPIHPEDERLSALAAADPDAIADAGLATHMRDCPRCGDLVEELRLLRTALAELPDVPPSRPLQLLPPAPEPRPAANGAFGWLRRLAAPAMAAGTGLALVGVVGMGAMALGGMAAGAGAIFQNVGTDLSTDGDAEQAPGLMGSEAPSRGSDDGVPDQAGRSPFVDFSTPLPWFVLFGAGIVLVVIGMVLRFAVQPRAG